MFGKIALIVDDSTTARTVLKHMLSQFDVVVESAPDGTHALEMLRSHIPDVIFLDHVMPGLDGFQVLQRLKGDQTTRGIPVVMYTSQAAPHYISEAKSLGAIAVIPKNVTDEQLIDALDRAELSKLEAANDDFNDRAKKQEAERESAPSASSGSISFGRESRTQSLGNRSGLPIPEALDPSANALRSDTSLDDERAGRYPQTNSSQPSPSPARFFLVAILLFAIIVAHFHILWRDMAQRQVISDLRIRVLEQEQRFSDIEAQLEFQQDKLGEIASEQLEVLLGVLLDRKKEQ